MLTFFCHQSFCRNRLYQESRIPKVSMPAPRQTVSYLVGRFREVGLRPDARHGQNFLVDLNLLELLARTADPGPSDVFLEVGTGTGSLTGLLAASAAAVVSVEIDEHLHQLASEALFD